MADNDCYLFWWPRDSGSESGSGIGMGYGIWATCLVFKQWGLY